MKFQAFERIGTDLIFKNIDMPNGNIISVVVHKMLECVGWLYTSWTVGTDIFV